jgi:hypothetical protein
MLASTVQFSSNGRTHTQIPAPTPTRSRTEGSSTDQMQPIEQTNPDPPPRPPTGDPRREPDVRSLRTQQRARHHHHQPSDPTHPPTPPRRAEAAPRRVCEQAYEEKPAAMTPCRCSTLEHHLRGVRPQHGSDHHAPPPHEGDGRPVRDGQMLLRKEVIQPHLPVRLPCYDFVPIASPTFDGSPHKG